MAGLLGLTICVLAALAFAKNTALRVLCVVVYLGILFYIYHISQELSNMDLDLDFLNF